MATTIYIKNMVCNRCIKVVGEELQKLGYHAEEIKLGEAVIAESKPDMGKIEAALRENGFELLDDRKHQLIEKAKNLIVAAIHHSSLEQQPNNFSVYLHKKLGVDYNYLSSLFSTTQGITIEKYIIAQRIERVKELIFYDELSLSEIAYKTGYSSVAHLSTQFKKVTGLTPSQFKKLRNKGLKPLDKV